MSGLDALWTSNASARPEAQPPVSSVPLLHDHLHAAAAVAPWKIALVSGGRRITYRELEAESRALANALATSGVGRGDRVVVWCDAGIEPVIAFWATLAANATAAFVDARATPERLRDVLSELQPAAVITDRPLTAAGGAPFEARLVVVVGEGAQSDAALQGAPRARRWNDVLAGGDRARSPARRCIDLDVAAIAYSAGATGRPKAAMLSHLNFMAAASTFGAALPLRHDDVVLHALPLATSHGLHQMVVAVAQRARLVLESPAAVPTRLLRSIVGEGVTVVPGLPATFDSLATLPSPLSYNLSSVRTITSAGAALPLDRIRLLQGTFPRARVWSLYGLTECEPCSCLPPEQLEHKPGSVGVAMPNTDLWVAGPDGQRVAPGIVGQIVVRGAAVTKGYWQRPDETAARLRPGPLPGDVVLQTGDLGRLDEDGFLWVVGRGDAGALTFA